MKVSHFEEKREDRQLDVLTDEDNGLRIIVSRLGAELISLARINEAGEGASFPYRENELSRPTQGWAKQRTVSGYYPSPLTGGRSPYHGPQTRDGDRRVLSCKR